VTYIEGNRDHPVNKGVLCAKGASGIMQVTAPSRLRAPLRRVGPRGSGAFEEISWDEALGPPSNGLGRCAPLRQRKLAFFTGRDQSQVSPASGRRIVRHAQLCRAWRILLGQHGGGGHLHDGRRLLGIRPDRLGPVKLFVLFGVAEDHDSNPIKMGIGKLKAQGGRMIAINPIRTGYNAVADDWIGITPGTDGLLILALIHELLKAGQDRSGLSGALTNAPCLVDVTEGEERGFSCATSWASPWSSTARPASPRPMTGRGAARSGRQLEGLPHRVSAYGRTLSVGRLCARGGGRRCGIPAARIRRWRRKSPHVAFDQPVVIEQPWTDFRGERHDRMIGRPVSFHAMRGISAHSNGFPDRPRAACPADPPGHGRGAGRLPLQAALPQARPCPSHAAQLFHARSPARRPAPWLSPWPRTSGAEARRPDPARIDKGFTWENPLSAHGLMHMVIPNAVAGDPYPIDTLMLYMANMAWNSSMNTAETMEMLTAKDGNGEYKIPRIIYSDAYASEMVAYADLILPDTTYLERHDCISLLDRPICEADHAADAIRWPVVEPDRDVRGFQSVLVDLAGRLGLPGFVTEDGRPKYRDYADYIVNHQRRPGVGPLMGFRGHGQDVGRGAPNPNQLNAYIANGGFFMAEVPEEARFFKPWNKAYQDWAVKMGFYDTPQPYLFQLYCEPMRRFQLAAEGFSERQPPDHLRERASRRRWTRCRSGIRPSDEAAEAYPLHALTQRPMAMYHSWGSQNAWLRQIHGHNPLYVPTKVWDAQGFADGDWARVTSPSGTITVPVAHMAALNENTVWTWNAIGKRKGAWALAEDAPEATKGFLAQSPDRRTSTRPRRWAALEQLRSDHRTGGVVRPAGQDRKGRRTCRGATGLSAAQALRCRLEGGPDMTASCRRRPPRSLALSLTSTPAWAARPA
jgi:anaerobic selenocysteine-containing dehydrogenase